MNHYHKIYMMGAMLLMLLATSCREESDSLLSYDHEEQLAFAEAETSYAAKFKVTWNGLNQYYALWDYEKEQGLDWDAVYDEYLPQFEALDERDQDNPVTDDELKAMLQKVLSPLHDGHFAMLWKNHATGKQVGYSPSSDRNASRDDAHIANTIYPDITYYVNPAHGEIVTDANGQPIAMEYSTKWEDLKNVFCNTPGQGMQWIEAEMQRIENLTIPTEKELFDYSQLEALKNQLTSVLALKSSKEAIPAFNNLVLQYQHLRIPGFNTVDLGFLKADISVKFALLKGNIAYFSFSGFYLTPYLNSNVMPLFFDMTNTATKRHVYSVHNIWAYWFYYIQQLHKSGELGGVVIDVRGNGGGMQNDGQYVVGALLPAGDFQYGYSRFKRGTGRYDYSPLVPAYMSTLEETHEIIEDKPIVLLTNSGSVSMSEMTAQVVKLLPNGTIIGKRTHGGLCGLTDNSNHSLNYAGHIGIQDVTPVYGYVPSMASFTMDKQQLEGVGISPDIEVNLDEQLFRASGQDTQLDRALQFIRTGN